MALLGFWGYDDTIGEPTVTLGGSTGYGTPGRSGTGGRLNLGTLTTALALGSSSASVVFGTAYNVNGAYSASSVILFQEGAVTHVQVGIDASGHLTIYGPAGTVVATSTATMTNLAWHYIEAKVSIADTGGTVDVHLDGTSVVTYTGDTRNAATGVVSTIALSRPGSTGGQADDSYALDLTGSAPYNDFLGDIAVRTLLPNGNGASSDFLGSDGNSTDNYLLVDETNSSSTDYVAASAAAKTDLYTMFDVPTTDLPLATQQLTYAAKSDAGTPPVLKPVTKGDGGTVREETAVTLSTTYQVFASTIRTTDPDGDALTATNVNAMQLGARTA